MHGGLWPLPFPCLLLLPRNGACLHMVLQSVRWTNIALLNNQRAARSRTLETAPFVLWSTMLSPIRYGLVAVCTC
jgi:hypothetical protein